MHQFALSYCVCMCECVYYVDTCKYVCLPYCVSMYVCMYVRMCVCMYCIAENIGRIKHWQIQPFRFLKEKSLTNGLIMANKY